MRPKLRLAFIDETEYWAEEIVQHVRRVAGVYLFDQHRRVHCCEFTASYECHLAGYLTERWVNDEIQIAMAVATDIGAVTYIHCWQLEQFARVRRRPGFRDIDPFVPGRLPCTLALPGIRATSYDDAIEEALAVLTQCGYTTT